MHEPFYKIGIIFDVSNVISSIESAVDFDALKYRLEENTK